MKMVYEFHGGKLNRLRFDREKVEAMADGRTKDCSAIRALGALCQRAELDNQPKVPGYLGPMWDGLRYILPGGSEVYDFRLTDEQKSKLECFGVLRYETQAVYDMLSN